MPKLTLLLLTSRDGETLGETTTFHLLWSTFAASNSSDHTRLNPLEPPSQKPAAAAAPKRAVAMSATSWPHLKPAGTIVSNVRFVLYSILDTRLAGQQAHKHFASLLFIEHFEYEHKSDVVDPVSFSKHIYSYRSDSFYLNHTD
jgi:hypothetical protein